MMKGLLYVMYPIDSPMKHTLQAKAIIIITTTATRIKPEAEHLSLKAPSSIS